VVVLLGCNKTESPDPLVSASALGVGAPSVPVPDTSASAGAASNPVPTASAGAVDDTMELLELTFTSEVKDREPQDLLVALEPGKRVTAHLRVRNRSDDVRKINVLFFVNNARRTMVDLKVEKSPAYRTWAYNTLQAGDKSGTVRVEVTNENGVVLAEKTVPIGAKMESKPYVKMSR